jgi:hypothetical protein
LDTLPYAPRPQAARIPLYPDCAVDDSRLSGQRVDAQARRARLMVRTTELLRDSRHRGSVGGSRMG